MKVVDVKPCLRLMKMGTRLINTTNQYQAVGSAYVRKHSVDHVTNVFDVVFATAGTLMP
jgi:hypothetical protein